MTGLYIYYYPSDLVVKFCGSLLNVVYTYDDNGPHGTVGVPTHDVQTREPHNEDWGWFIKDCIKLKKERI